MLRAGPILRLLLLAALPAAALSAPKWDPVPADQLGVKARRIDPECAAQGIFRRFDIDDSDFPSRRSVIEYSRYRIYEPEKAAGLTRLKVLALPGIEIAARLTLPDGAVRVFGKEAIRERQVVRSAPGRSWLERVFGESGPEVKEKFLAVTGIEAGSVLEFQLRYSQDWVGTFLQFGLQQEDVPCEHLRLAYKAARNNRYNMRQFTLNGPIAHAVTTPDAAHKLVTITGEDVPGYYNEPFSGPYADHGLMFIVVYRLPFESIQTHHTKNFGSFKYDLKKAPWAPLATEWYFAEQDRAGITRPVTKLAQELKAQTGDPVELAGAIHRWVVDLHQRYNATPRTGMGAGFQHEMESPEQLMKFDDNPTIRFSWWDFLFLEYALDRAAGFEAQLVLLPNRDRGAFSKGLVADAFLPDAAVRVNAGGAWHFSCPATPERMAFGAMPWENQGQVGLVVVGGQQNFIPVPLTPPSYSLISNRGEFSLAPDGTLSGTATRTLQGHPALIARATLQSKDSAGRKNYFHRQLNSDLKGAEITVESVAGVDDPNQPITIRYAVDWEQFATATRTRLIFKPGVFHSQQGSPFTAQVRHYNFEFPYDWMEKDEVVIAPPTGFSIETKQAPPSIPGEALDYRCGIAEEVVGHKVHYTRGFTSKVIMAPASVAPQIKRWYDAVAARDQFELVFLRAASAPKVDTGEAP